MSPMELDLFRRSAAGARFCVEFGCGGSTLEFLRQGVDTIVSVESDKAWIDALATVPMVRSAIATERLALLHADIGPVKAWGRPASRDHRSRWPSYAALPWDRYAAWPDTASIVLVDGRFRVSCCLAAVEAILDHGRRHTKILFHDFLPDRPKYENVLAFCEIVYRVEGLVILRPRPDLDRSALRKARQAFNYVVQ